MYCPYIDMYLDLNTNMSRLQNACTSGGTVLNSMLPDFAHLFRHRCLRLLGLVELYFTIVYGGSSDKVQSPGAHCSCLFHCPQGGQK